MSSGWEGCIIVLLSCFVGTAISHAGTTCRDLLSATSFNVAGNLNKVGPADNGLKACQSRLLHFFLTL